MSTSVCLHCDDAKGVPARWPAAHACVPAHTPPPQSHVHVQLPKEGGAVEVLPVPISVQQSGLVNVVQWMLHHAAAEAEVEMHCSGGTAMHLLAMQQCADGSFWLCVAAPGTAGGCSAAAAAAVPPSNGSLWAPVHTAGDSEHTPPASWCALLLEAAVYSAVCVVQVDPSAPSFSDLLLQVPCPSEAAEAVFAHPAAATLRLPEAVYSAHSAGKGGTWVTPAPNHAWLCCTVDTLQTLCVLGAEVHCEGVQRRLVPPQEPLPSLDTLPQQDPAALEVKTLEEFWACPASGASPNRLCIPPGVCKAAAPGGAASVQRKATRGGARRAGGGTAGKRGSARKRGAAASSGTGAAARQPAGSTVATRRRRAVTRSAMTAAEVTAALLGEGEPSGATAAAVSTQSTAIADRDDATLGAVGSSGAVSGDRDSGSDGDSDSAYTHSDCSSVLDDTRDADSDGVGSAGRAGDDSDDSMQDSDDGASLQEGDEEAGELDDEDGAEGQGSQGEASDTDSVTELSAIDSGVAEGVTADAAPAAGASRVHSAATRNGARRAGRGGTRNAAKSKTVAVAQQSKRARAN